MLCLPLVLESSLGLDQPSRLPKYVRSDSDDSICCVIDLCRLSGIPPNYQGQVLTNKRVIRVRAYRKCFGQWVRFILRITPTGTCAWSVGVGSRLPVSTPNYEMSHLIWHTEMNRFAHHYLSLNQTNWKFIFSFYLLTKIN